MTSKGPINFFPLSKTKDVGWICDENSAGNTGMVPLWLSSVYIESRSFLLSFFV